MRLAHKRWSARTIFLVLLVCLTLVRLVISGLLELHFDEAYYWHWANNPQLSYYDHPPMVAWFIMAGTAIVGDNELGIRLFAQLGVALASWFVFDAADRTFGSRAALFSGVAIQATVLVGAGSIIMAPDTPLLLFTTALLWALLRFCQEPSPLWLLLAGVMAGGALLSKYTAVVVIAAVGLWLLATPRVRPWLFKPWPWAALALSALIFSPVLIWNVENGWLSFAKQGGRLGGSSGIRPELVLEYIGGQLGVVTPILFGLLLYGVFRQTQSALRDRDPVSTLLVMMFLVPAVFFLVVSPLVRVQANWPAFMWPAAVIATGALISDPKAWSSLRPAVFWSIATGGAIVVLVWMYALGPYAVCFKRDPIALLHGKRSITAKAAEIARNQNVTQILSREYATASWLRFYAPADMRVAHLSGKPRYIGFDDVKPDPSEPAVMVSKYPSIPQRISRGFSFATMPIEMWQDYKGCSHRKYYVFVSN